jgi:outer membrane protein assembly factor BamD (BamD/ComL family)
MAEAKGNNTYLTSAMKEYQSCAERYPNSLYAGQALEKVAGFYMKMNDYPRAVQLMENIELDFPDIRNPKMLLMWAIALDRQKRYAESLDRMEQLVSEFPDSPEAGKATGFIDIIRKKVTPEGDQAANP